MINKSSFTKLFEPAKIGRLDLLNRIVMPAITTLYAGEWGEMTDTMIDYYVARAKGGVGLIIVQPCVAQTTIDRFRYMAKVLRIDEDHFIAGLSQLVDAIHNTKTKVCFQLTPGAGAQAWGGLWTTTSSSDEDIERVSPSGVPSPHIQRKCRPLTIMEIEKMVELTGRAAGRIKQAGADAVELHAHGGYLIAQFMSPYFNKRQDRYGRNVDGRLRFLVEIVEAMRHNVGADFPIIVRYSIAEYWSGGRESGESQYIAHKLEQAGVDAIDVSVGIYGSKLPATAPMYIPEGYLLPSAQIVREAVKLPLIVAGRLDNLNLAEQVLREGKADFIGMGRPLVADPDLPRKVLEGRVAEIRKCIFCNWCRESLFLYKPMRCSVNAVAGREGDYEIIRPAAQKKVYIIGAGPAGMEAARVAALRGHNVTLYEKTDSLGGGQLTLASRPPHKEVFKNIIDYYSAIFQLSNVSIEVGKEKSARDIVEAKPDVVIVATGGEPLVPDIADVQKNHVVTSFQVLAGEVQTGQRVIIVGGGSVGCETANHLAGQGREVTVVEMLDEVGIDMERWTRMALMDELSQGKVKIITGAIIEKITDQGVTAVNKSGSPFTIEGDTVVLACGVRPVSSLEEELTGKIDEVYIIGDARSPGRIMDAIADGYAIACEI